MKRLLWRLFWPLLSRFEGGLEVGDVFPDFTLRDTEGRAHSPYDGRRQPRTALWFTNLCEDCRARLPWLEELRQGAGERFRILAVSLLGSEESLPRQTAARCGFPVLLDPEDQVGKRLGLEHPPETCPIHNFFVLDESGRVLFKHHLSALKPEAFRALWRI